MKVIELQKEQFSNFVNSHEFSNPWQTVNFAEACKTLGYEILYVGFEDSAKLIGASLLLTKNVYLGQSISYAPRGIVIDYNDYNMLEIALEELKNFLNNKNIMSITMDPPVIANIKDKAGNITTQTGGIDNKIDAIMNGGEILKSSPYFQNIKDTIMKKCKFEFRGENLFFDSILPRWYSFNNLPINPKKLLGKIDKRMRNKLRKAAKYGVEIYKDETHNIKKVHEILSTNSGESLEYYNALIENNPLCEIYFAQIDTEKYVANSKLLYEKEIERNDCLNRVIQENGSRGKHMRYVLNRKMDSDRTSSVYKEHLIKSTDALKNYPQGKIIAVAIIMRIGSNVYIFEDGLLREHSNLCPLHLLRWKLLEHYSQENVRTINFGAITGEFDYSKNPYKGLNETKLALRGNVLEYIGEFGIMTNKAMYNLYLASKERFIFKI